MIKLIMRAERNKCAKADAIRVEDLKYSPKFAYATKYLGEKERWFAPVCRPQSKRRPLRAL